MSKEQKLIIKGRLEEEREALADVETALRARINSVSCMIMPEMDIEDQKFDYAHNALSECLTLKSQHDELKREIKRLEEAL